VLRKEGITEMMFPLQARVRNIRNGKRAIVAGAAILRRSLNVKAEELLRKGVLHSIDLASDQSLVYRVRIESGVGAHVEAWSESEMVFHEGPSASAP
jgi:hypothetical protein